MWVARTTAHELTGQDFTEPENVDYLHAPLDVWISEDELGLRTDVNVRQEPMRGERLLRLLNHIAPFGSDSQYAGSHKDAIFGTIDDWLLVYGLRNGERSKEAERLINRHAAIGPPWDEFRESGDDFIRALQAREQPEIGVVLESPDSLDGVYAIADLEVVRSDWDVDATTGMLSFKHGKWGEAVEALEILGIPDADERLSSRFREDRAKRLKVALEWPRSKVVRQFTEWDLPRKRAWLAEATAFIFKDLFQVDLYGQIADDLFLPLTVDGKEYAYNRLYYGEDLQSTWDDAKAVDSGRYSARVVDLHNRTCVIPPGWSLNTNLQLHGMNPLIAWRHGERRRQFVTGQEGRDGKTVYDATMGALAVAYFSPEVLADHDQFRGIGRRGRQLMGAAQIPLLTLMHRGKLAKSDFVQGIDELVRAA